MDNKADQISNLLKEWENSRDQLETLFRERKYKNAKVLMEKGITLFIQFLSWSNEVPVRQGEPLTFTQYEFNFVISRPNLYHAYRQLSELMIEQEKLFMKRNILKKASKP
jgi:hypothetical protein